MNQKEIQEAAEREYPQDGKINSLSAFQICRQQGYISGFQAALNSDTVKGMAEALRDIIKSYHTMSMKWDHIKQAEASLNNYNKSIKTV